MKTAEKKSTQSRRVKLFGVKHVGARNFSLHQSARSPLDPVRFETQLTWTVDLSMEMFVCDRLQLIVLSSAIVSISTAHTMFSNRNACMCLACGMSGCVWQWYENCDYIWTLNHHYHLLNRTCCLWLYLKYLVLFIFVFISISLRLLIFWCFSFIYLFVLFRFICCYFIHSTGWLYRLSDVTNQRENNTHTHGMEESEKEQSNSVWWSGD